MSNATYVIRYSNGRKNETFTSRKGALAWARKSLGRVFVSHSYTTTVDDGEGGAATADAVSLYPTPAECRADRDGGREYCVLVTQG